MPSSIKSRGTYDERKHPRAKGKFTRKSFSERQQAKGGPKNERRVIPPGETHPFKTEVRSPDLDTLVEEVKKREAATGLNFAQMIDAAPEQEVSLHGLIATQFDVDPQLVKDFMRGVEPQGPGGTPAAIPLVIKFHGKNYIKDGHNRLTAAWLKGANKYKVKYLNLD